MFIPEGIPKSCVSVCPYPSSQVSVTLRDGSSLVSTTFITELTKAIIINAAFSGLFQKQQQIGQALASDAARSEIRATDNSIPARKQPWNDNRRRLHGI